MSLKYRSFLSLIISVVVLSSLTGQLQHAQTPASTEVVVERPDRVQLYQALLDLTNPWTVMCVAAHPDDEDGSSLTLLRRKYGAHTVSLFSTYGEGGQNAVGPELYEDLGVIRARETFAAAEVQGSEAHFLGLKDFGFSKSAEEAFAMWGEKEALRRMVLQIRQLRPDVIITNHDTKSGHGHHQATGRLVLQAFDAAADPTQFPEQLKQVTVWQPKRLFVRGGRPADPTTPPSPAAPLQVVTMDPNEKDPVRGTTYAQQALTGLQQHATQGPWPKAIGPTGGRVSRYTLVRQVQSAAPLPADAKTPFDGLTLPDAVGTKLTPPTVEGKGLTELIDRRLELLVSLINARRRGTFSAPKEIAEQDPQRFELMSTRLDKALAIAAGAALSVTSEEPVLVTGEPGRITASLANTGAAEIQVKQIKFRGLGVEKELDTADKMLPGTETTGQVQLVTPASATISVPSAEHLYDGRLFGERLAVEADLTIEGVPFTISTTVNRDVAPAVEIVEVDPSPYVITPATSQRPLSFRIKLHNNLAKDFRGLIRVSGQSLETGKELILRPHGDETVSIAVRSTLPLAGPNQGSNVKVTVDLPIPKTPVTLKTVPLVYAEAIVVAGRKVGYLPSFDQTIERALAALGVDSSKLTTDDIKSGDLTGYHTIIIDNRGYEAHPELVATNDKLLKYVEQGGTLLVFYHKTNEWNPDERRSRPQLAPYPLTLSDDRVTDETAPIVLLQPKHPLLNFPNRITQADFSNWIQERGLYFPNQWDPQYTAVLSTNDKGEAPLKGGVLVAPYGRGNYIYTSLVWYRQLRAGLPGGYRFFANLISYGRRKEDPAKP
jgi:LmbE family N-acetylglucosaminyl deacetylase